MLTQESIQSRIGIVLQTPHLFSGSIEENIRQTDWEIIWHVELFILHNTLMV